MNKKIFQQIIISIEEANLVCFLVSARDGLTHEDLSIAKMIRKHKKSVLVLVNKIDGLDFNLVKIEFYALGFSNIHAISATNGIGISILVKKYFSNLLSITLNYNNEKYLYSTFLETENVNLRLFKNIDFIKIAVVGKPNVGKSTLVNNILDTYRMITDDEPGTTRDSIWNVVSHKQKHYVFIDTAGVKRNNKIKHYIEKFSVQQTFKTIKLANVVILMIDSTDTISDQDLILFNYIINSGCGIIIVFNKCDKISRSKKNDLIQSKKFNLIKIGDVHFISAIQKLDTNKIFLSINKTFRHSVQALHTAKLTKIMKLATEKHQPPIIQGNKIKLKYAHLGRKNPLTIIIHGNKLNFLSSSYKKYLSNFFIKTLKIVGNPVHFYFKNSSNPFLK
ncbi:MAG: ribosome biogenesis GTPase Der [Buchnera aphidicola (Schlechtendalia peitan)]